MKKRVKRTCIVAVILVAVGFVIALLSFLISGGKLGTTSYEEKTYSITENFSKVSVEVAEGDVILLPCDEGSEVVAKQSKKISYTVEVVDGVLTVKEKDSRRWYGYIGIFLEHGSVTLKLPQTVYENVSIVSASGNLQLNSGLTVKNANLSTQSGEIVCNADIAENLTAKTKSGNIRIGQVCVETLKAETSSGNIRLEKAVSGGLTEIRSQSGNVRLTACDAGSYDIKTSSGNVEGTLLSGKTFQTKTGSGNVKVPQTTGGICKIQTASGNIFVKIIDNG